MRDVSAGGDVNLQQNWGDLQATVESAVKRAVKDAVLEAVEEGTGPA
jgi:hypothetical protein